MNKKNDTDNRQNSTNINWYPGHMAKTKREITEKLELIDIVFEVIDARTPISSKNDEITKLIKNKPRILIMSKKDLCDINITNKWVDYYKKEGYEVLLLDLNKDSIKEIFTLTDKLTKDLKDKWSLKGLKPRKIRALVLGIPNVGKSTLINKLTAKKATSVGNRPGVTRRLEWIRANEKLELLDTPGILVAKLENQTVALNLASTTSIKEELIPYDEVSIHILSLLNDYYPNILKEKYSISKDTHVLDMLDIIAKKIGAVRNNEIDYDKVYLKIINDMKNGKLGQVTFDRIGE